MTKEEQLIQLKYKILGYKKGIGVERFSSSINPLIIRLSGLTNESFINLPPIREDELRSRAYEVFNRHFKAHDIKHTTQQLIADNQSYITNSATGLEVAQKFNSLLTTISPFDLPITYTPGHSMVGQVLKPLVILPYEDFISNVEVPFDRIELGDNLTELSIATLIHEITHTLIEPNRGYTENFQYKEVLSILLEKIIALELDETGELLKLSERTRYQSLLFDFYKLKMAQLPLEERINSSIYVTSTPIAEKLFDKYVTARKVKDKQKFLRAIQLIFDHEKTIESFISEQGVTFAQGIDLSLTNRHL